MAQDRASELFNRHIWPLRATVMRTALFLCRNSSDADDLAQETMLKAYKAIHQFDENTNAQAWLLTILRNTRIDKLRSFGSRAPAVSLEDAELDIAGSHTAEEPRTEDELRQIATLIEGFSDAAMIDALKSLPEDICWTLLLADVEQLDYVQASEILGVPVGTVKSRVHRGRQMLKKALMHRQVGVK